MKKKIVIVITRGLDDERANVAWSIANAAVNSELEVTIFLASAGVDWARKGAADTIRLNPEDPPLREMIQAMLDNGSFIGVCPPCAKVRGYTEEMLIDGATITGPSAIFDPVVHHGAETMTF